MAELPTLADRTQALQLERVVKASKFFETQARQHPEVLQELLDSGELHRRYNEPDVREKLGQLVEGCEDEAEFNRLLRQFRRRQMLRIIWRDFNRLAATLETTRDVSLLAEATIGCAQQWWHNRLTALHGEPRDGEGVAQQLLVIAMGKLGARELNLSSDVDLIFVYPRDGNTDGDRALSNQEFFIRLGQKLIRGIDDQTVDGFVFRVDMRLRPYGQSGALAMSFAAMEEYYQEQGRDWERYALIKARVISGDEAEGEALMTALQPFVYRRYIDFGAIESLRSMKEMINAEVRNRGLEDNVKLGPGGIREIEFIAQCFQLIRGGRAAALRRRELVPVLAALVGEDCLSPAMVGDLTAAYLFLRNTEHAIQGYEDKQTQVLPTEETAREALITVMGFDTWEDFMQMLDWHRDKVREHFAGLIAPAEDEPQAAEGAPPAVWPDALEVHALAELGYQDAESVTASLVELRDSARLRQLQSEGRDRLDRFMPRLLRICGAHSEGDTVLRRLLPLVQALARRSAYLVLLLENPPALEQLVRLCAASPWVAELLTRNPSLLDELLDPGHVFSAANRGAMDNALQAELKQRAPDDHEANLEALCYFKSAQQLHIVASEVTGRLPLMKVSDKLTFLAEVIVEQAVKMSWLELTDRHGRPPGTPADNGNFPAGTGFAVLGYGKFGGIEMGHGSDLDMVFVYDAPEQGATDGERSLDSGVFYTRLGQRIIHIIDTRTAFGQLYAVDMRLRPSGESGMLSTSLEAFDEYQRNSAWTWEHQALVRARFVAGDPALGARCMELRDEVLRQPRDRDKLREDVVVMRDRMREQLLPREAAGEDVFHLKHGQGGIVDIEFLVQYAVLAWSQDHPELTTWSDNLRILETLGQLELFPAADCEALTEAYIAFRGAAHELSLQQQPGVVEAERFAEQRAAVTAKWDELLGAAPEANVEQNAEAKADAN